jgi:hypothetical protein
MDSTLAEDLMRSSPKQLVHGLGLAVQVGLASLAAAAPSGSIPYRIQPESMFEAGCLAPCMCPALIRQPVSGTMNLLDAGAQGLFHVYDVRDVDWNIDDYGTPMHVVGAGTYRVGGESGGDQRLELDLAIDSGATRHYDSGLVPGGEKFPQLDLPVAINGFFCHDSVFGVQARPTITAVTPVDPGSLRLAATPNPFQGLARIDFMLPAPGRVDLKIYDLSGRVVRALSRNLWFEAGPHSLAWDGRAGDGTRLASGIYFVSLKTPTGQMRGTMIKL